MTNSRPTPEQVLKKYWGYDSFRPVQREIIDSVLSGRDTIGLLPTGGGKSVTFQVPAMMMPGLTIVVTPLISLMKDQVDNLLDIGVRACLLHSGMTRQQTRLSLDRCALGKTHLLYISPERLQTQSLIDRLRLWDVSMIVVDEAHCISQWGYDFRPSYLDIAKLRHIFPSVPVLALTATATPEVVNDITDKLEMRAPQIFKKSFARDNISYIVRRCDDKDTMLLRVLRGVAGTAIVYVRSRARTRLIAEMLCAEGISADYYHAGLDPAIKTEKQNNWKNGTTRVIVATNAFGMGIDKSDVRAVVHYDLPSSLEEYYQEAGRAGRDGNPSYAVVLATPSDKAVLTKRLNAAFPPKDTVVRIYELVGNHLDIAVGEGYENVYEFNLVKFCQLFGLEPDTVDAALSILTNAGYIEYVHETTTRSRAMFIVNKRDFYSLRLDKPTEAVFLALQRCYTGLFADFVYIDENYLARNAVETCPGITSQQVYDALLTLSRMRVIDYVPRKTTPYIIYTTSRELPKHVIIPRHAYEDRRERMAHRIEAMRRFVFSDDGECRVRRMLEYFGETDAAECGTCDVCRSHRPPRRPATTLTPEETIRYILSSGPKTFDQILRQSPYDRETTTDAIRDLQDRADLTITSTGLVTLTT